MHFKKGSHTDFQNKKGKVFYLQLYRAVIRVAMLKGTKDHISFELLFPVIIFASGQGW